MLQVLCDFFGQKLKEKNPGKLVSNVHNTKKIAGGIMYDG